MSTDSGARLVAGRYRLDSELGRGGMGIVWHAWDTQLQRHVAVKEILLPSHLSDVERSEARARVLREARSAARVPHPSIVTVHDVFDHEDNPWVVMELIPGRSLDQVIAEGGTLSAPRTAEIAKALLEGLRAAHEAGVVHRDIKPGNVMVCDDDRVVITDFGIATVEGGASITRTGALVGSPEYMPPERFEGGAATPAGDLWSAGVTLYAALSGSSPFHRESITGAIAAVLSAPIPPVPQAGPLEPLIGGLLERDPGRRLGAGDALRMLREQRPPGGAGTPAAGTPSAGPAGVPFAAPTPAGGMPSAGTPAGGVPAGTPAAGLPAAGTPAGGVPGPPPGGFPGPGGPGPEGPGGPGPNAPSGGWPSAAPAGPPPPPGPGPGYPGPGPVPGPGPGPGQHSYSAPPAEKKKGGKATPLVFGLIGCGLVLVLVIGAATVGLIALSSQPEEPVDPPVADPSASASPSPEENPTPASFESYDADWYSIGYPEGWTVYDDELEPDGTGAVSFYDPTSERRLMVATWDNTGGLASLDQLETDDERFSSSDDYENYRTDDLRQVPASELPSGWGSEHDVAVVVNRYTADDWDKEDRHLTEYNVVVGDKGYALSMNVPEEDAEQYEQTLQDALNSWVIK
ncbi:serine/threonine-protein kinase [Nocardiopsis potens]|uniref:serine/threonine-protein kinase n=1 Tax=Nocardiopsis potens TaxID=1246458 RepID=UPI0003450378|nr:serine/threonine-protein kinase [Nocardiopsis potens]